MSQYPLCLHHELALLILDDTKGTFVGTMVPHGLAGAMLSELLVQGLINVSEDKDKIVSVVSGQPTGDALLDEAVSKITASPKPYGLQHWVMQLAHLKNLSERIAVQLSELGVLKQAEDKVLWLFTRKIWPELDGSYENALRARMAEAMFAGIDPDERTAVLITLANATGVLQANFPTVELRQHAARTKEICEGKHLAAGATVAAIAAVQAASAAMVAVMTATIAAN